MTTTYKKLQRRTLVQQVYDCLRTRIVRLELKPGEKIDLQRLSIELSVSQTPLREALQRLVEQGFVESKPYVGYFVVQLTQKDIQQLFDLRKALEILALKYVYANNIDIKKLQQFLERLTDLEQRGFPVKDTQEFDEDFHLGFLINGSKNKWLKRFANGVLDLIRLTTNLSVNPEAACVEHRAILLALYKRDLEQAILALENHLDRAKHDAYKFCLRKEVRTECELSIKSKVKP